MEELTAEKARKLKSIDGPIEGGDNQGGNYASGEKVHHQPSRGADQHVGKGWDEGKGFKMHSEGMGL